MIEGLAALIKREDDFLVAVHVQPDGDAIGAALALGRLLRELGKSYRLAVADGGEIPPQYKWLPGIAEFTQQVTPAAKVFVTLDVANESRLGRLAPALAEAAITVNIDHHPDNPGFADHNWVDSTISSTSEMIFYLWEEMGVELTYEPALAIYVGMLTDTGRWQYSNTTSRSLRIAAELVRLGVKPIEVFKNVYESYSVEWFKLLALGLDKAVFDQDIGLAYTLITQEDLAHTGASLAESENLVDRLRSVIRINLAMVLKETRKGEIKVSLRSREPIDVGALARLFGGGGHRNASGFVSKEKPETIIESVKQWLTASS